MKKILLFLTVFILNTTWGQFLSLDWFDNINSANLYPQKTITNNDGEVYNIGAFIGDTNFDPSGNSGQTYHNQGQPIFIQKLDAQGNYVWDRIFTSVGSTGKATDIKIRYENGQEYVYVLGYFIGTIDFDPGSDVFQLSANDYHDIFLLKLDSAGNFIWARQFGNPNVVDVAYNFAFDSQNNIYLTGFFNFPPYLYDYILDALVTWGGIYSTDMEIIKLDTNGNILWNKVLSGNGYIGSNTISVNQQDEVIIAGDFQGTIDFDPGNAVQELTTPNNISHNNSFILKLDQNGNFIWVKQLVSSVDAEIYFLKLDQNDNLYLVGGFSNNIDFDPGPNQYVSDVGHGNGRAFLLKLSSNGEFVWVDQFLFGLSSISFFNNDRIFGIAKCHDYREYSTLSGNYQLTGSPNNPNVEDILVEINPHNGELTQHFNFPKYNNEGIYPYSINFYNSSMFMLGIYLGTDIDFDPGPGELLQSTGFQTQNGFIIKYDISTSNVVENQKDYPLKLYPNPTTDAVFYIKGITGKYDISITDVAGKIIKKQKNVTNQTPINIPGAKGVYFVRIETVNGILTKKLIVK